MLELQELGFRHPGADWLFRNLSLAVEPGTATVVLGPNGRGKTTLVRCAAGLLRPTEGSVRGDAPVGYVPQTRVGAFAYTAADMVLMGRARHVGTFSVPGRRDVAAARESLARVGIGDLGSRAFPTLSGGEQQLVLVARALASEAPVLVLDEPATGLDLRNQGLVLRLLRNLVGDGLTLLMTTHHPDHALLLATSVVLMGGPEETVCGPAPDLLTDERLSRLYGVEVRSVEVEESERRRRALVTTYADAVQPSERG